VDKKGVMNSTKEPLVCVIGVGALGSHLLQFIRNEKMNMRIVDHDRVEQKNVMSQFHSRPSVGKSKVVALQQTMDFLFKRNLQVVGHKLVENNIDVLLRDAALVVDCLDNATSRKLVQDYSRKHNLPCLHGALAPGGAFGRVIWTEQFVIDSEVGAATCEDGDFLPFIALTAAYMARSVQIFLRDKRKVGFSISPAGSAAV
jgi:molybdopterin/thiamine biosynthesis adenylyltransferase